MAVVNRLRFSLATIMMIVLAAASGSAAFASVYKVVDGAHRLRLGEAIDQTTIVVLAIALTALAIGAIRRQAAPYILLQATIAYLLILVLAQLASNSTSPWAERAVLYWFQGSFGFAVVLPLLLIRVYDLRRVERSERRQWWRCILEAPILSFLNLSLVGLGLFAQLLLFNAF